MIKQLFRQMSTTQIFSAASTTFSLLIDSIVIGRMLGVDHMSAFGLASPVLIVLGAIGLMCATGVQVVSGRTIGAGDHENSNACYSSSVVLALGIGVLAVVLVFLFWPHLCVFLGAGEASPNNIVFRLTGDYLKGYIIGIPFYLLSQIMAPYLQICGKRKLLMWSVVMMWITNIVADILVVRLLHLGIFGIGLASSLSYLAAVVIGGYYLIQKSCPFHFVARGFQRGITLGIIKSGSPVIINQICFTIRVYFINQILLAISGTTAVAVFASVSSLGNLFFSVGLGTGAVAMMLASIFYSEEDRNALCTLVDVMFRYVLTLILVIVLLVELAAPWIARLLLGNAPEVLSISLPALRIYMISLIPCVIIVTIKNFYQGTLRIGLTHLISVLDALVMTTLFAWIGSKLFGLNGVWAGIIVGELAVCVVILLIAWKKHGGVAFSEETLGMLDQDFGVSPENCFNESISDLKSAISVSQQVHSFCDNHGIDARTSYFIGLSVEEMTCNIIKHGFSKDSQPHNIDLRLIIDGDDRLLRIRDNCIYFDPTAYLELHQTSDPAAHIGIRMVMKIVKEANYIHSLGLNNLTLRF